MDSGCVTILDGYKVRFQRLDSLLKLVVPYDPTLTQGDDTRVVAVKVHDGAIICESWAELVLAWRKALRWTDGLDTTLAFMLAVATSTEMGGEQLWGRVLGPPSCGKTTLCDGLGTSKRHVFQKDNLTRLTSGYQSDAEGVRNHSMVEKLKNKTLVVNDGDTLMKSQSREQVMAQLRAFYGRNIRSQYGNRMSKDYENVNTTIVLCGTAALKNGMDHSELGERFLDCWTAREIDTDLEDEIVWRATRQADRECRVKHGGSGTGDSPEVHHAKRMTGAYLDWLRFNAPGLADDVVFTEESLRNVGMLAKFVAYFRARPPSRLLPETVEREMAQRLAKQMVKLATYLAVATNRDRVDGWVMARLRKVALDTSGGKTLRIAKVLHEHRAAGMEKASVAVVLGDDDRDVAHLVDFLVKIRVCRRDRVRGAGGTHGRYRWRLTELAQASYEAVVLAGEGESGVAR